MLKQAVELGESLSDGHGMAKGRVVSRRRERCFVLKRSFRVDESAADDLTDGQRTVSRRRERYFMLKRAFRVDESATDDPTDG